ncbi:type II toxin-antitoxin system HicB family antitoxin [Candidatus Micrarchaeota archaeon]|nr:type II toxin-antitoxin system HicB family antitoxin [Candidatus Micrarchaeota archaeon]MBU2476275.1 type II toxin-antitoxin system HicB family antitoxin [Candidatus Micrarchaeota archaeon]
MKNKNKNMSLPVFLSREGKWFTAACPLLGIATQGKTEKEVKENMQELIEEYFNDPDTKKPSIKTIQKVYASVINVPIELGVHYSRASVADAK